MSQEQEHLRFSVEETVWFQKGQEVAELLSISLDPDISIHEHDQYISIRGALQLTGEYKIDNEAGNENQVNLANVRYVNDVRTGEDGISLLSHRFPVDITIPRNRIQDTNDVYVSIDSFDYELPDLMSLKLVADLSISGIVNEDRAPAVEKEPETEVEELEPLFRESKNHFDNEPSFGFPSNETQPFSSFYNPPEAEEDVDKVSYGDRETPEATFRSANDDNELTQPVAEPKYEEPISSVTPQENDEVQSAEEETLYDPFTVEVRKQDNEHEEQKEVQYSFFSKTEAPVNRSDEEKGSDASEKNEKEPKDAHYLTSLFARDDEEDFSRVKMCIVQQGDTIDLICERYDISVQQLLRVNDIHADQDVYEGQILYIPAYSTTK